jgi:hypothetical protein
MHLRMDIGNDSDKWNLQNFSAVAWLLSLYVVELKQFWDDGLNSFSHSLRISCFAYLDLPNTLYQNTCSCNYDDIYKEQRICSFYLVEKLAYLNDK